MAFRQAQNAVVDDIGDSGHSVSNEKSKKWKRHVILRIIAWDMILRRVSGLNRLMLF